MSRLGTELASSVATSERPCLPRAAVALVRLYLLFAVAAVDAVSFGASRPTATHHPVCVLRGCVCWHLFPLMTGLGTQACDRLHLSRPNSHRKGFYRLNKAADAAEMGQLGRDVSPAEAAAYPGASLPSVHQQGGLWVKEVCPHEGQSWCVCLSGRRVVVLCAAEALLTGTTQLSSGAEQLRLCAIAPACWRVTTRTALNCGSPVHW